MTFKKQSALVFGFLCLAAVAFQNCGRGRMAGDVIQLSSISPDQIADLAFWSVSKSQADRTLFGEDWTVLFVLPRPTTVGTILNVSNGIAMSEGVNLTLTRENRLQVSIAQTPNQVTMLSFAVEWRELNILVITMPKELKNAGIILNGKVLSFSNTNEDRGSFVERFVEGGARLNSWLEAVGYDRVLKLSELQAVHRYFEGSYSQHFNLTGWNSLILATEDTGQLLSFQRDIQPIFEANHCYQCHGVAQPAIATYSPVQIESSVLRTVGAMPQGFPALSEAEKLKIQIWVDQGALP